MHQKMFVTLVGLALVSSLLTAYSQVDPSVNSFEIDGDYGSIIESDGDVSDGGHRANWMSDGSGKKWFQISQTETVTPYMGSNCYKVLCEPSVGDKDRSEQKMLYSWDLSDGARFFSLAFCVPSGTTHDNWFFFSQWWQGSLQGPPLTIHWTTDDTIALASRSSEDSFEILWETPLIKDKWYRFMVKVEFGFHLSGSIVLWQMDESTGGWVQRYLNDAITLGWEFFDDDVTPAPVNNFTWKVGTYRGVTETSSRVFYDNIQYGRLKSHITKDYLVGYHKNVLALNFDEASGTSAADSSNYNNDGVLVNGPLWKNDGVVGSCLQFDGSDDVVKVPVDITDFDFGNYLTAAGWFKSSDAQDGKSILCMDEYSSNFKFRLTLVSPTQAAFVVRHPDDSIESIKKTLSSSLFDGSWHHIAGVYNRWAPDGGRLKLYIDGVKVASAVGADKPLLRGDNYLYVGKLSGSYFSGKIDEIGLYNYPMTDSEISTLYNLY